MAKAFSTIEKIDPAAHCESAQRQDSTTLSPSFRVYDEAFLGILGPKPQLRVVLEDDWPWAHEAGVFIPSQETLFVTSNQVRDESGQKAIYISRAHRRGTEWTKELIQADVPLANGGINYGSDVLFCAQGSHSEGAALTVMDSRPPYRTTTLLNSYHGRAFNSPNDVVIKSDRSIWFTDPIYGFEQGIRPAPQLPSQLYRFDPNKGNVRAVADGFSRPNGLAFSPDESTLYVTDTDWIHGDGSVSDSRVSSIYAFDVIRRHGGDFLANKRLFAMADCGVPDGIKCDLSGNVYSGCGDGLNVWNAAGTLLGKIIVPGGVANFCFGRNGELFLLNETKLWHVQIAGGVKGALLTGMGIYCNGVAISTA